MDRRAKPSTVSDVNLNVNHGGSQYQSQAGLAVRSRHRATMVQLERESASLTTWLEVLAHQLPLFIWNPYSLVTGSRRDASGTAWTHYQRQSFVTTEVLLDGAESRSNTTNDIAYTPSGSGTESGDYQQHGGDSSPRR